MRSFAPLSLLLVASTALAAPPSGVPSNLAIGEEQPVPVPTDAPLSDEALLVHQALTVRHDPPACDVLVAGLTEPRQALIDVVEHTSMPPWAPMRAAACLSDLYAQQESLRLVSWVSEDKWAGLGQMLLGRIDSLPVPVSVEVAKAALTGPVAETATRKLAGSSHAELRALVTAP